MNLGNEVLLDVSGVCCPLPIIQMTKAIRDMQAGQILCVLGNDPLLEPALRDYCQATGHELIEIVRGEGLNLTGRIRVAGAAHHG